MQKWEYKKLFGWLSEDELNRLGNEGWELVAVTAGGLEERDTVAQHPALPAEDIYAYLKRPKS